MLTLETKVRLSSSLGFEAKPSLSLFPRFNVDETPREALDGTKAEEYPARIEKIATVIRILDDVFLIFMSLRLTMKSTPIVKLFVKVLLWLIEI